MLFVSKKVIDASFLDYTKSANIQLLDVPMISFSEVPFNLPKAKFEVIFFTSPRSAGFFLNQFSIPKNIMIASIGEVTTQFIEKRGYTVHFTGISSGEPDVVSKAFKQFVDGRIVLFPQSNVSHRSMQKNLSDNQIIDLVVYETINTPIQLEKAPSVLVFTSPSNFISYIEKNTIDSNQKVIAWGKTTAATIVQQGYKADYIMKYSSFQELEKLISSIYFTNNK